MDAVEGNDLLFSRWYNASDDVSQWQPNDIDNVCMLTDPHHDFMWTDADCTQPHPYVCQQGQYPSLVNDSD